MAQTKRQLLRDELIKENLDGRQWLTTKDVLAEEKRLIDFVQDGRGKFNPFRSGKYQFQNPRLSDEQRNAVRHVLQSTGRVTAIRGGAGTGKTTMMREAVAGIESSGLKVFTFAPSAEASRGVLRSDARFANAETVEALLQNEKLQAQVRGQVIWIDEAGLLSVRTLARVADLAEKGNCRIILSGDTAQHRAVERGDALRLLEQHANLQAVELTQIRRQIADAHKAVVADLRSGNLENAFKRLDKLGMLREMDADQRHETLAADYVAAVKAGKSVLVISPTHAEGERVTREIRAKLKSAKKLGADEREFVQLKNLQWTAAQRADARNYQTGMVIQFHQNVPSFRRGERVTVKERDATSYSSQSKGVECVFVAESSESFRAAGREQFYVSVSRFKENLTIYTDDKCQLLEAVRESSHRPSATDLVAKEAAIAADEPIAKEPEQPEAIEAEQNNLPKPQRWVGSMKQSIRRSHSRVMSI